MKSNRLKPSRRELELRMPSNSWGLGVCQEQKQLLLELPTRAQRSETPLLISFIARPQDDSLVPVVGKTPRDESFIRRMYRGSKALVKRAVAMLSGLLHTAAQLIFGDRRLHEKKILFIKLHDTGYAWLLHQKHSCAYLEDCKALAFERTQ